MMLSSSHRDDDGILTQGITLGHIQHSDTDDPAYAPPRAQGIRLARDMRSKHQSWIGGYTWLRGLGLLIGLMLAFVAGRLSSQHMVPPPLTSPDSMPSLGTSMSQPPAVATNITPQSSATAIPILPQEPTPVVTLATPPFKIVLTVMAYNRPKAFKRALESLRRARYGSAGLRKDVPLRISIDHYPLNPSSTMLRRANSEVSGSRGEWLKRAHETYLTMLRIAETFDWPYGEKIINVRTVNGGTQGAWLQAWYPSTDNEFCFFMEDDLVVSPDFYLYFSFMIARYAYDISLVDIAGAILEPGSDLTTPLVAALRSAEAKHATSLKRLEKEPHRRRIRSHTTSSKPIFPYDWFELQNTSDDGDDRQRLVANPKPSQVRLFGISLQRQYLVPGLNALYKVPIPDRQHASGQKVTSAGESIYIPDDIRQPHPFLYQEVGTWGQLMFPQPWREFVQYYERVRSQNLEPALPGTIAEQWSKEVGTAAMWTPYHQRWAFETKAFTVYANLPFDLALSDSMRDRGVTISQDLGPSARLAQGNDLLGEGTANCQVEATCVPGIQAWVLPPLPLLERYDMCFRRVPHGTEPSTTLPIDCSKFL